jgi:phospholipase C
VSSSASPRARRKIFQKRRAPLALAEAFTVCDAYHCSVLGPTWPNRLYWMTGTLDAEGRHGGPLLDNTPSKKGFTWTTYAERLQKAGVSWKLYHQKDEFGTNLFWQFKSFRDAPQESDLFRYGLTAGHADQFERDVKRDRLPTVSWILPTGEACEHPDHWPAAGAAFVARKIEALASNPDVWNKTVLILNYDENDGLFDHVVPPTPPPHTPGEYIHDLPIGAGFRVPCVIVSLGRPAAGSRASDSITPRCCGFSRGSPAFVNRISRPGDGKRLAI